MCPGCSPSQCMTRTMARASSTDYCRAAERLANEGSFYLPVDHMPDKRKQSNNTHNFPEQRAREEWRAVRQLSAGRL